MAQPLEEPKVCFAGLNQAYGSIPRSTWARAAVRRRPLRGRLPGSYISAFYGPVGT